MKEAARAQVLREMTEGLASFVAEALRLENAFTKVLAKVLDELVHKVADWHESLYDAEGPSTEEERSQIMRPLLLHWSSVALEDGLRRLDGYITVYQSLGEDFGANLQRSCLEEVRQKVKEVRGRLEEYLAEWR